MSESANNDALVVALKGSRTMGFTQAFESVTIEMHEEGAFRVCLPVFLLADPVVYGNLELLVEQDSALSAELSEAFIARDANRLTEALRQCALSGPMRTFLASAMQITKNHADPWKDTRTLTLQPV
jgi:hypothetical protein